MSRNENHQMPLHFAVRHNRPEMVALLLELGADPLAVDGDGFPAAVYATAPGTDRALMERMRAIVATELDSAVRGRRKPRLSMLDLVAVLALGDWQTAGQFARESPELVKSPGALHLMAKRNDGAAVKWLLDHGADPNARWAHWDSQVTPLHLAVLAGHPGMVRLLLEGGADPTIHDSKHDSDALGWAEFFKQSETIQILKSHIAKT